MIEARSISIWQVIGMALLWAFLTFRSSQRLQLSRGVAIGRIVFNAFLGALVAVFLQVIFLGTRKP